MEHSAKVYDLIKDRIPSGYYVVKGIKHCGIYREKYMESVELAGKWFLEYL